MNDFISRKKRNQLQKTSVGWTDDEPFALSCYHFDFSIEIVRTFEIKIQMPPWNH